MFPGHSHDIRTERDPRSPILLELAALDEAPPIATPALVGRIDGIPVAAMSLVDERSVADPFHYTHPIRMVMRLHARSIRAHERQPSLIRRIVDALRLRGVVPAASS
jgi:hypothetical protein